VTEQLLQYKEFYWAHREVFRIAIAAGVIVLFQSVMMLWMLRRTSELAHMRERLSRLADGLALLTDTTESGLSTLLREMQQARKAPARSTTRASVSKRIATAARQGGDLGEIAMSEALSESEVRLHLTLAEMAARQAQTAEAR
jgi:hypothetical protein